MCDCTKNHITEQKLCQCKSKFHEIMKKYFTEKNNSYYSGEWMLVDDSAELSASVVTSLHVWKDF